MIASLKRWWKWRQSGAYWRVVYDEKDDNGEEQRTYPIKKTEAKSLISVFGGRLEKALTGWQKEDENELA
jgi:hypothetical protein